MSAPDADSGRTPVDTDNAGEPGVQPPQDPSWLPVGTRSAFERGRAWWVWDPDDSGPGAA